MCTEFWEEILKGRDYSEDTSIDGEDNIKMYLSEIGWKISDWIYVVQDSDK
jgi:hypothetical protein